MRYKDLLERYMRHVILYGGSDFLAYFDNCNETERSYLHEVSELYEGPRIEGDLSDSMRGIVPISTPLIDMLSKAKPKA